MDKRDVLISKSLSYLLRHGALKENLPIDSNGYVQLSVVLTHNRLKTHKCTYEDVIRVIENNDKKRFDLKIIDGIEYIAATQGHSMKNIQPDENTLIKIPPSTKLLHPLIHGTNMKGLEMILQSGYISKMKRNHIHLSPGIVDEDSNVISGMRKNSPVLIYINPEKLSERGNLFKSLNEVFLTPDDIPLSLFDKVVFRFNKPVGENILHLLEHNNIEYIVRKIG